MVIAKCTGIFFIWLLGRVTIKFIVQIETQESENTITKYVVQ